MSLLALKNLPGINKHRWHGTRQERRRWSGWLWWVVVCTVLMVVGAALSSLIDHARRSAQRQREADDFIAHSDAAIPTEPLPEDLRKIGITLVTTAFPGYSAARQAELTLTRMRNAHLRALTSMHIVCEKPCNVTTLFPGKRPDKVSVWPVDGDVTYGSLLEHAGQIDGTIVIAHADIVLTESIHCARLLNKQTVLALSRHADAACPLASGYGESMREPMNLCGGFHPQRQSSADAFIFSGPVPEAVVRIGREIRLDAFGAENVLTGLWMKEGLKVVNACKRIRLYHTHCSLQRSQRARMASGSLSRKMGTFGSVRQHGLVDGLEWMRAEVAERFRWVDCETLGAMS